MELKPQFKLLYQYILDRCDSVGVWKPNTRLAEFFVSQGEEIDWDGFIMNMGDRLSVTDRGNYWLTKFCDFQYGDLHEGSKSNPVQSYIKLLKKHNLWEGYSKGTATLKEQEQEQDKVKVKEKEKKKLVQGKCLMKNSGVTLYDVRAAFQESNDLKNADVQFYYDSAMDWSEDGNVRSNWTSVIRNFARRDLRDGKLKVSVHKPTGGTNLASTKILPSPVTGKEITREEYLKNKAKKKTDES